jgi:hypothetical protein
MSHIEVVATDGTIQKRVLWLDMRKNGIYAGLCRENIDVHISYHADGNVFQTVMGKSEKITSLMPLKDFRGISAIASFAFSSDISQVSDVPYDLKQLDGVIYVDSRSFSSSHIGCNVVLLEPKRFDLINSLFTFPVPISEFHLFTKFKPWILIYLYEV